MLGLFDYISIAVMVILLGLSGFFSATETSYSTFNRPRMKKLAQDGNRRAQRVLQAAEKYDKMLTTVLIGNNIVNLSMSSLGTLLFIKIMGGDSGAAVSTAVITIMVLIFGEISPKNIAKEHADAWALSVIPVLRLLMFVFTPFTALFSLWKKLLDILFHKKNEAAITDEELKTIVDEAEEDGGIDPDEGKLIRDFGVEVESYVIGADGIPAYTELVTNNPNGYSLDGTARSWALINWPGIHGDYQLAARHPEKTQVAAYELWGSSQADTYRIVPGTTILEEYADEYASLWTDIDLYINESRAKFINGELDLDADWDNYIETLKKMGMDRVYEMKQATVDAYNAAAGN